MEQATFVQATFIESQSLTLQGNRNSIKKYLNNGYYIKENRNGFWVLVKPSAVLVLLKNSTGQQQFNMKESILSHYAKQRMTYNLFERFNKEASAGIIKFCMEDGCYSFK